MRVKCEGGQEGLEMSGTVTGDRVAMRGVKGGAGARVQRAEV